jgi:glycosyltransferase involved in cell wall biosynthesis
MPVISAVRALDIAVRLQGEALGATAADPAVVATLPAVPPSLSVVIPIYNEPAWIGPVVDDLVASVSRSPFENVELIVVDDGSDTRTQTALEGLHAPFPLRVLRQENSGRFAARRAGIEAAAGDLVLLLDARVSIGPDALAFVVSDFDRTGQLPIWNAHVEMDLRGNPFGRFWRVIEFMAFRDYLGNPRTTSYGLEEFDRYPKGTTCFMAPREMMLEAVAGFRSYYEDLRDANDDTPIIRALAEQQPINISPGFSCLYRPRGSLRPFVRHAFHRGGVFVDGYGRPGTRFFAVIVAFYPVSLLTMALAVRRPRQAVVAAAAAPIAAAGLGVALERPREDSVALATVGPLWLGAFAAGMWRGLWLALRASRKRRR